MEDNIKLIKKRINCKIHMPHDEYVDEKHKPYK
jgi:hypothetical protein